LAAMDPTVTKSKWVLTKEGFDSLLAWLSPEREQAALKYEEIRLRLIKIFVRRGCTVAEELADQTINRVIKKLPEITTKYTGDPALYFYGVANKIIHEYQKPRPEPLPMPAPDPPEIIERNHACLDRCMEHLTPANRDLILKYFQEQGQAKINLRKDMSEQLGLNLKTLRVRAFRIKDSLKQCVLSCLKRSEAWADRAGAYSRDVIA
jgi:DNA-directed RNA polymerase specialized sigma24 family protein